MPSITITVTAEQQARIAEAFQHRLGLDEPATAAQVKTEFRDMIVAVVRDTERDKAIKLAFGAVEDIPI